MSVAWAFFRRGALEAASYRAAFAVRAVSQLLSLGILWFFARFVDASAIPSLRSYGGSYLSFALVGMLLLNFQQVAVSVYPRLIRESQLNGTLEALMATPTPAWLILLCAPLYSLVASFIGTIGMLLVGVYLLDAPVIVGNMFIVAFTLLLCPLAFASLGFHASTVTMLLRRSDPVSTFVGGVSVLLGGVFYPTTVLRPRLRLLGQLLPITHALELLRRGMFGGASAPDLLPSLAGLSLTSALLVPTGLFVFSRAVRRARRNGSLTHY